jgi:hypothetical protein
MEQSGQVLIEGTIPVFVWKDWGKPRKTSVRIAGLRAETLNRHLPNKTQECWPFNCEVGRVFLENLVVVQPVKKLPVSYHFEAEARLNNI